MGAKRVIPWFELLSWFGSWIRIRVWLRKRRKDENCPPRSRISVMLIGPAGLGAGADWERVDGMRKRKVVRVRRMRGDEAIVCLLIMVVVVRNLWGFYWGIRVSSKMCWNELSL